MKVYTAGKIWHAPKFQYLRDVLGYDVNGLTGATKDAIKDLLTHFSEA